MNKKSLLSPSRYIGQDRISSSSRAIRSPLEVRDSVGTQTSTFSDDTSETAKRCTIYRLNIRRILESVTRTLLCKSESKGTFEVHRPKMKIRTTTEAAPSKMDDPDLEGPDVPPVRRQLSVCNPDEDPSSSTEQVTQGMARTVDAGASITEKAMATRPNDEVIGHLSEKYPEVSTELRNAQSWGTVRRILREYWTERNNGKLLSYCNLMNLLSALR